MTERAGITHNSEYQIFHLMTRCTKHTHTHIKRQTHINRLKSEYVQQHSLYSCREALIAEFTRNVPPSHTDLNNRPPISASVTWHLFELRFDHCTTVVRYSSKFPKPPYLLGPVVRRLRLLRGVHAVAGVCPDGFLRVCPTRQDTEGRVSVRTHVGPRTLTQRRRVDFLEGLLPLSHRKQPARLFAAASQSLKNGNAEY